MSICAPCNESRYAYERYQRCSPLTLRFLLSHSWPLFWGSVPLTGTMPRLRFLFVCDTPPANNPHSKARNGAFGALQGAIVERREARVLLREQPPSTLRSLVCPQKQQTKPSSAAGSPRSGGKPAISPSSTNSPLPTCCCSIRCMRHAAAVMTSKPS